MNSNKICFITCVNKPRLYDEALLYISELEIPDGFTVDVIAITDAISMASGYNKAMRQSDAMYKIYLHQDVFIRNKNFLKDVLAVFHNAPKLGIVGVIGAKKLPDNGVWWDSDSLFGQVVENHLGPMKLLKFNEPETSFESIEALDGLIMATQSDINWRDDLFDGFHFYDSSQCKEFITAGFGVGILKQEDPWVMHDCGNKRNWQGEYEKYRQIFVNEYLSKDTSIVK